MKNKRIIIIIICSFLFLNLFYNYYQIKELKNEISIKNKEIKKLKKELKVAKEELEEYDKKDENAPLSEITFNELENMINNKEDFILLISQTNCSHCINFKPILIKTLEDNNIKAYDFNLTNITKHDYNKFVSKFNVTKTPTILFFIKGIEQNTSRIVGGKDQEELEKVFINLGFL